MLTARVVDRLPEILELINRKSFAAISAAAEQLADNYKTALQRNDAPPHSSAGEIPHRYFGHKTGGFGPQFGDNEINNRPESGFARVQDDYLATYIEGGASNDFGEMEAYVGFADSHVVTREQNYLLRHDRNDRPWVLPVFRDSREEIADAAAEAFRDAE